MNISIFILFCGKYFARWYAFSGSTRNRYHCEELGYRLRIRIIEEPLWMPHWTSMFYKPWGYLGIHLTSYSSTLYCRRFCLNLKFFFLFWKISLQSYFLVYFYFEAYQPTRGENVRRDQLGRSFNYLHVQFSIDRTWN